MPAANRASVILSSIGYRLASGQDVGEDIEACRAAWPLDAGPVAASGLMDLAALEAWFAGRIADARAHALASNDLAEYPAMVVLAARCSIALGDGAAARADLAILGAQGGQGPALAADRAFLRGGIAALSGESVESIRAYRDAVAGYRALGLRWDLALCGLGMIELLPDEPEARLAAEEARDIMVELGATPFITRVDAALASTGVPAGSPTA